MSTNQDVSKMEQHTSEAPPCLNCWLSLPKRPHVICNLGGFSEFKSVGAERTRHTKKRCGPCGKPQDEFCDTIPAEHIPKAMEVMKLARLVPVNGTHGWTVGGLWETIDDADGKHKPGPFSFRKIRTKGGVHTYPDGTPEEYKVFYAAHNKLRKDAKLNVRTRRKSERDQYLAASTSSSVGNTNIDDSNTNDDSILFDENAMVVVGITPEL